MFYITFYITWDCGVKSKCFFTFYLSEGTFFISVLEEFNFLLPFFKTSPDCFGSVDEGRRYSPDQMCSHLVLPFHNAVPEAVKGLGRRPVQSSQRFRELVVRGLEEVQLERILPATKYNVSYVDPSAISVELGVCARRSSPRPAAAPCRRGSSGLRTMGFQNRISSALQHLERRRWRWLKKKRTQPCINKTLLHRKFLPPKK